MPERAQFQCRGLSDLVQRGQDTNFNFGAVSCRFTVFTRDRKYLKNHAKYQRFCAYRFAAWPDNAADVKCNKPKPKGVT
jgi:hypothetical protein